MRFYEVVIKCCGDEMLMRPDPLAVSLIARALAGACLESPTVELVAFCFLSNHAHLVLRVTADGRAVSAFMKRLDERIARDLNEHRDGRKGHFFRGKPKINPILDDAGLYGRLTYTHAQPVHHDLVERAEDWPGLSSFRAVCDGKPFVEVACLDEGAWREAGARPRALRGHTRTVRIPITPIPQWAALCDREARAARRAHELSVREREREKTAERAAAGNHRRLGKPSRLTRVDPFSRPAGRETRNARPWAHGAREAVAAFRAAYSRMLSAYRVASAKFLTSGERHFPEATFKPWAYWLSEVT